MYQKLVKIALFFCTLSVFIFFKCQGGGLGHGPLTTPLSVCAVTFTDCGYMSTDWSKLFERKLVQCFTSVNTTSAAICADSTNTQISKVQLSASISFYSVKRTVICPNYWYLHIFLSIKLNKHGPVSDRYMLM